MATTRLTAWILRAIAMGTALAIPFASGGCSLLFVNAPPPEDQRRRAAALDCTESRFWPVVDVLFAAAQAAGTVVALARDDSYYEDDDRTLGRGASVVTNLAFLGLFTFSAVTGFTEVNDCHAAVRPPGGGRAAVGRVPRVEPAGDSAPPAPAGVSGAVDEEDPGRRLLVPQQPLPAPGEPAFSPQPAPRRPSRTWPAPTGAGRGG